MDKKSKQKLEHILEIAKNTPRALFEGGLFACTRGGPLVAVIGTSIAYLSGSPEIAKILGIGGGFATGAGLVAGGLYTLSNSTKEYRNLVRLNKYKINN